MSVDNPSKEEILATLRCVEVLREVGQERMRQDDTWGQQNHSPEVWLMILGEEVGEANKHALEAWVVERDVPEFEGARRVRLQRYRKELIQVAAVAVAMVESLDRNELGESTRGR